MLAEWLGLLVGWLGLLAEWLGLLAEWLGLLAGWQGLLAEWLDLLAEWLDLGTSQCSSERATERATASFSAWSSHRLFELILVLEGLGVTGVIGLFVVPLALWRGSMKQFTQHC